jgi:hypothetical protein
MRNVCRSLIFLPLLLLACNKHNDEFKQPKITPALLREPSCSDTTDDGIFETWNSTEDSLILPGPTHYSVPDSLVVPGYLRQLSLLSRSISLSAQSFTIKVVYDTGVMWTTQFYLVNKTTGDIEGQAYAAGPAKPNGDSLTQQLTLSDGSGLTPGCHRLYYFGWKAPGPGRITGGQILDSMTVLFKGHFDVEVY